MFFKFRTYTFQGEVLPQSNLNQNFLNMSSHFAGTHQPEETATSTTTASSSTTTTNSNNTQKPSFWQRSKRLIKEVLSFYPSDLSNPHHRRLMNQAKVRAVIVVSCFIYFGYHHPEYSIISAWYHGSDKPLAEQRYEKLAGQKYGSQKMQENVLENIMEQSQRSVFEPKVEQQQSALSKLLFGSGKKDQQQQIGGSEGKGSNKF